MRQRCGLIIGCASQKWVCIRSFALPSKQEQACKGRMAFSLSLYVCSGACQLDTLTRLAPMSSVSNSLQVAPWQIHTHAHFSNPLFLECLCMFPSLSFSVILYGQMSDAVDVSVMALLLLDSLLDNLDKTFNNVLKSGCLFRNKMRHIF